MDNINGSTRNRVGDFCMFWELRQKVSNNFHGQVLFVAESIRLALDDANRVVQSLDAAERDFVLGLAVRNDAVPMTLDHGGELLKGLQPLPLEAVLPVVEELPGPGLALVIPQLPKRFLEQIGRVEPLIGGEQRLKRLAAIEVQVLPVRQQGIAVALDETALLALYPTILGPAHVIQRLVQMAQDVEFVEHDLGLRGVYLCCLAKRFPHVHHRSTNTRTAARAEGRKELCQVFLLAAGTTEPDGSLTLKVAHYHAIFMPLADGNLIHTDRRGGRHRMAPQLLGHIQFVQVLDGGVMQSFGTGHVLDGHCAAQRPDVQCVARRVPRVTRQPVQVFHMYPAVRTAYAHPFEFERDTESARTQIPRLRQASVVDRTTRMATARAGAGLFLRRSRTTRQSGSPNTPLSFAAARNPGNEYSSHHDRARFIDGPIR